MIPQAMQKLVLALLPLVHQFAATPEESLDSIDGDILSI
jgi:hypothetical protein